ncbi:MAG: hypothetical protein Fues2KO_26110 [Fuerstiella sp.]
MTALELIWYCIAIAGCVFALADWRKAIYVGIVIDALRDPVRKLIPEQPILITLSGVGIWLVIVVMVLVSRRDQLKILYANYPKLRSAVHLMLIALVPAAAISTISYGRGWLMALIGGASYVIPMMGVLTGFAALRTERDIARIMYAYVVVNVVMLIGVPLEYLEVPIAGLGGIEYDWIRYHDDQVVDLMCGWYRSPDIMGLHAAHVIMFSLILAIRPKGEGKGLWLMPVLWAAFCLLVSGRRKMVGIPMVFVAVFLILGLTYRVAKISRLTGVVVISMLIGGAAAIFFWSPDESAEYTDFATSLFTEGWERSNEVIVGSTLGTLQQAGIIGGGLGTATQGRHYAGVQTERHLRGWQEDGVSRLFLEFGVPGVCLLVISVFLLLSAFLKSLRSLPRSSNEILMQLGLVSVIAGDAASFAISHQQFSGDPVSALLVTLMVGMVLKFPGLLQRSAPVAAANAGLLSVARGGDSQPAGLTSSGQPDPGVA